jgi:hypothetical protein
MNQKKAKALRRLVWSGKGNPPGCAVLEEVEKPFSKEVHNQLKCWGPRAEYQEAKRRIKKARRDGKNRG